MIYPLEIMDLHFRYREHDREILKGVNVKVDRGEVLAIVGLSGSGKSTLCYCMCGVVPHIYHGKMDGQVKIFGIPTDQMKMPAISTKVGIVYQDPDTQLFSPTIEDEIAFGPENLCIHPLEIDQRIHRALQQVDMETYRFENPNHLSGGQKQLIAIASVLSLEPDILIFDEIMSQIDEKGKARIKETISSLKRDGKTIVMIEHDLHNLDIADRTMILKKGKLEEFTGEIE
ncbi:MAG: energy-coupling factor ABC transporter ATP-binding protein [Bacillota bacterium]